MKLTDEQKEAKEKLVDMLETTETDYLFSDKKHQIIDFVCNCQNVLVYLKEFLETLE